MLYLGRISQFIRNLGHFEHLFSLWRTLLQITKHSKFEEKMTISKQSSVFKDVILPLFIEIIGNQ